VAVTKNLVYLNVKTKLTFSLHVSGLFGINNYRNRENRNQSGVSPAREVRARQTSHRSIHMANSTTARVANYTPEMTALVVSEYNAGVSVEDIAAKVVKSVRSIRSKLVREGVYVAKPKVVSRKVEGPTKKELLVELSTTGYDVSGLEGATKDAIARLMVALASQ
jgi:hypothetical protein